MLKKDKNCDFCKDDFPDGYQVVSKRPKYWLFMLNREPQCNFHCMIVFKASIGHVSDLTDDRLPKRAMEELGIVLKKACMSIKKADSRIENVFVVSLNTGKGSKHLHFHLIPKRHRDPVKMVNKPREDGGGMFFLGRKELVASSFIEFLNSTTGNKNKEFSKQIREATKEKVAENAQQLRKIFRKIW